MGKRRDNDPFENNSFVDGFLDSMDPPEGEHAGEVSDAVWAVLEKADGDARKRKIIWEDGTRLSTTEPVQRIHAGYPDYRPELLEEHLIGWLEMEFAPPTYSQKQLDELDRLAEKWIDHHER